MKTLLKKAIPTTLLVKARPWYHGTKARLAAARFQYPGRELTVIGITGTKGKTTTATFTGRLLNLAGIKAGYITTSVINTGDEEFLNPHKMTTIDGVKMQHYLRQMVSRGCTHVVVELSSQGLEQHRHWGLSGIDAGVFLNIYPRAHRSPREFREIRRRQSPDVCRNAPGRSGLNQRGLSRIECDVGGSEACSYAPDSSRRLLRPKRYPNQTGSGYCQEIQTRRRTSLVPDQPHRRLRYRQRLRRGPHYR